MSQRPRTQQERSQATQARLLDATIRCLVQRGYAGTSTTEVCKAAEVSRGAQLHHFPTKAELVAAAIEQLFVQRHADFRSKLDGIEDQDLRLDAAVDALWEIYSGPTLYAWMELVIAARTDEALRPHVAAVDARFIAEAVQTFERLFPVQLPAPQVAAATRLFTSLFDGLALHNILEPDPKMIEAVLATFKHMIRSLLP
jgi:AcrR family transcriptional regulator